MNQYTRTRANLGQDASKQSQMDKYKSNNVIRDKSRQVCHQIAPTTLDGVHPLPGYDTIHYPTTRYGP